MFDTFNPDTMTPDFTFPDLGWLFLGLFLHLWLIMSQPISVQDKG